MTASPLRIEREGSIAILTMDSPQDRNAFSLAMRDALTEAFVVLGDDVDCRAIVLTGAGGHFSSGGDFKDFPSTTNYAARGRLEQGSARLMRLMAAGRTPVVAAVEGFCVGAGVSLAAASDFVVMSETAQTRCAFIRAGLMPDLGGLWALPRRIGLGHAKRMAMLGREVRAPEALQIGLADELAPEGGALEAAKRVAQEFAAQPPLAIALMRSAFAEGLDDILRRELDLQPALMISRDHREAVAAFFEKRPGKFTGE